MKSRVPMIETPRPEPHNIIALVKGEERYVFIFDDKRRAQALLTLGKFARDPELSFSWYDAAVLSQRIRAAESAPATDPHAGAAEPVVSKPRVPDLDSFGNW